MGGTKRKRKEAVHAIGNSIRVQYVVNVPCSCVRRRLRVYDIVVVVSLLLLSCVLLTHVCRLIKASLRRVTRREEETYGGRRRDRKDKHGRGMKGTRYV